MSTLKEILEKLKDKRAEAAIDAEGLNPKVRSMGEGIIRNAKREIVELEKQYKKEVSKHALIIGVTGPGASKFAEIAKEDFKTLSVDYMGSVKYLTASIEKRGGRKTYGSQEHFMLMTELNQIKVKSDMVKLPQPQIGPHDGVWEQPIADAINKMFVRNYGGGFYSAITLREIETQALKEEFSGKTLPVVVYNLDVPVDTTMLREPYENIETTSEDITKEFVKSVLMSVKNKLKSANK